MPENICALAPETIANCVPDTDAAVNFLLLWESQGPWLITAIAPDRQRPIQTRQFIVGQEQDMRAFIEQFNGRRNIYFSVNRACPELAKKAEKSDLLEAVCLHVDCDPRVGEDIEKEQTRILARLSDFTPAPTAIIFSGGGYQALFRLREPLPVYGDEDKCADVETYNRGLMNALDGDPSCFNLDRILRVPGTVNLPDEVKRRKGRTPALARLVVWQPENLYSLEDFKAAPRPHSPYGAFSALPANVVPIRPAVSLDDLPDAVGEDCRAVIVHGNDPTGLDRWPSRSEALFWVCCELARSGVDDGVILGIITDAQFGISESVRDKGHKAEAYARRQLVRAHQLVTDDFQIDDKGRPHPRSQHNIRLALAKLGAQLSYDEFADRLLVAGMEAIGPHLDDAAVVRLYLEAEAQFGVKAPKEFFYDVVTDAARKNGFDPVGEYLDELRWDGEPRLNTWLSSYGGAKDTPLTQAVGAITLIAAVRRVRQPGCKFDEMLVLESPQGKNKSSALRVLAVNDDWFSDDLPLNADSKKTIEALAGHWIVEAAELNGMRKGDVEHLKSFLSRGVDKARLSYDRLVTQAPRRCIIVGTTNSEQYLKDGTGNRRFWPVRVDGFDLERLRQDRDQLWAEAVHREAQGESIRLDPALYKDAASAQEERQVEDPFYERLAQVLGDREGKMRSDSAWRILGVPSGQRTQHHNARLGEALRRLGFARKKLRFGGASEWCYVRGDASNLISVGDDGLLEDDRVVPF